MQVILNKADHIDRDLESKERVLSEIASTGATTKVPLFT